MIKTASFTHAQFNTEVVVYVDKVFSVLYMPTQKCTGIVADGGAAIPVNESVEEVIKKIEDIKAGITPAQNKPTKEEPSGISKRRSKSNKRAS